MRGHVFVLRGDLTTLVCDAVLVPADARGNVVREHWEGLLVGAECSSGDRPSWVRVPMPSRWSDVVEQDRWGRRVRVVDSVSRSGNAGSVADVVAECIRDLAPTLTTRAGRARPLVALPLVGTGQGGLALRRGHLIRTILPALRAAADQVDVALVLRDERDHQAVQALRGAQDWGLPQDLVQEADRLGDMAGRGQLSLFLGAGVSVPLGAPTWRGLVEAVAEQVGSSLDGDGDLVAQTTRLEQERGIEAVQRAVVDVLAGVQGRCAPAHVLLAALEAERSVTTNYDTAFETAVRAARHALRVLARELPAQPQPWLLKLHGDVERPDTIVLTEAGYQRLHTSSLRALVGVVEALLHTGHLLFVGYSLADRTFLQPAGRVADVRRLADPDLEAPFATVVALAPEHVQPHDGVQPVSMTGDVVSAARQLEVFLDRVSWRAARTRGADGFLLDDRYADLRRPDDEAVVQALRALARAAPHGSVAWPRLERLFADLGMEPECRSDEAAVDERGPLRRDDVGLP